MEKNDLSVVMPVYNEKNTILKIIDKVLALNCLKEVIVIDDCSTDGTKELLSNTKLDRRVKLLLHNKNMGKGGALRTGFKEVTGSIVAIQDADLEYDPKELEVLIKPIEEGVADVVYGSRLSGGKPQRVHLFWHKLGNTMITFLMDLLFNTTLTDVETCYKVFKSEYIKKINIKENRFGIDPEITAKLLKENPRIYEVPISYYGRSYAEGKKISWLNGFEVIWAIIKYRFIN